MQGLRRFWQDEAGFVATDWVAMGIVVIVLGIAALGLVGDDKDVVMRTLQAADAVNQVPERYGEMAPE
ncbi:MAG: hypothetical protein AAF677_13390 [Pseudomonadota bacterium]